MELEQESDLPPKVMKGGDSLKNALFRAPSAAPTIGIAPRVGIAEPNFSAMREKTNYKNYACTFTIKNAHSEKINCIVALRNGIFATGSSDKTIKVWSPLE
jgi:WD40 repeat protein